MSARPQAVGSRLELQWLAGWLDMRRPDRLEYDLAPVSSSTSALPFEAECVVVSREGRSRQRSRFILAATLVAVLLIAVALIAVASLVATALFHGADDMDYITDYDDSPEPTVNATNLTDSEVAKKRELLDSAKKLLDKFYRMNNGMSKVGPMPSGHVINAVRSQPTIFPEQPPVN